MKRKGDTVRYTVEEIDDILARGESRTGEFARDFHIRRGHEDDS